MNIPSFHQNDLFNQLSKHYDEFEVIYDHLEDEGRINQGWSFNQAAHYSSKVVKRDFTIWQLIYYVFKNRKATHIVNGIWAEKSFFFVIILLNIFRANFLVYSEAPIPVKNRSLSKKLVLKFIVRPLSKLLIVRAKGFLAVSIFAVEYFESLGVETKKIYRFGYFRNVAKNDTINLFETPQKAQIYNKVSLIFVGQLIERKGVTNLLKAVKAISKSHKNFHLSIIGSGELEPILKAYITLNQLQDIVTLKGIVSSNTITNHIERADLLILPSIFDGWGMVINEALQSHVPVLVSDRCGAKELVNHCVNGFIFQNNNVQSLIENLQNFLKLSVREKAKMQQAARQMGSKIDVTGVSNYLILCLDHCLKPQTIKPTAPWLNE